MDYRRNMGEIWKGYEWNMVGYRWNIEYGWNMDGIWVETGSDMDGI